MNEFGSKTVTAVLAILEVFSGWHWFGRWLTR